MSQAQQYRPNAKTHAPVIAARVSRELAEAVDQKAADEGRSRAAVVAAALRAYVAQEDAA